MQDQLNREFSVLPQTFVAIALIPTKSHDEATVQSLRTLLGRHAGKGCYITAAKPSATLRELFTLNGVPVKRVPFIDCVTGDHGKQDAAVRYVASPHDLTGISIQLGKLAPKFAILDSLNALLLHNSRSEVLRFIHALISSCRAAESTLLIIGLAEDSDHPLIAELEQFCDSVIELH